MYERLSPMTPKQINYISPAPPFAMECSTSVLRSPELRVPGPTSAIGYPVLTCVPVLFRYLRRCRPQ